jgi:hypothetical protein
MKHAVSLHISGKPASSLGDTKQDPKAQSDILPYKEPNKKFFDMLGCQEYDHEDAPELDSREENEKSMELFNIISGGPLTQLPVKTFSLFLSPSRSTSVCQAPKDSMHVSERLDLHNSFDAGRDRDHW